MKHLLTIEEAAEYLRVTPATIYRWCRSGKLPAIKVGKQWRLSVNDLKDWLEQQKDDEPGVVDFGSVPEHILGLVSSPEQAPLFLLFLLKKAQLAGARLVYASLQPPKEFRARAKAAGINTAGLENSGRLVVTSMTDRSGRYHLAEIQDYWRSIALQSSAASTWLVTSCFGPPDRFEDLLSAEQAMANLVKQTSLLSICVFLPTALHPDQMLELVRLHTAAVLFDPAHPLFLRQAPIA
ncbi:MAG: helix-turn-helix domain-containing protein [Bacillota bacterium]